MFSVMTDERARTADRLEAGKWLGDRAFGRAVQVTEMDIGVRPLFDPTPLSFQDALH
jgi:hypothetical protein